MISSEEDPLSIIADVTAQSKEFERILDLYFRRDPVEESNLEIQRATAAINDWTRNSQEGLEVARKDLDAQLAPIRDTESQIRALEQRIREAITGTAEQHNQLVAQYNALVDRHRVLGAAYSSREDAYNRSVQQHNQEHRRRAEEVELVQKSAHKEFEQYRAWRESRGEERFSSAVNACYAKLGTHINRNPEPPNIVSAGFRQIQAIRRELAEHARKRHAEAEHGMLVVSGFLCGLEECSLVVDTGAQLVAVTPELIEVLGLVDRLGDEIEMVLPGNMRVKGRRIVLPSLSILGSEAENVEAVVLKASEIGVDGLLGLSFLSRFQFEIVKDRPMRLQLRPKDETPNPASSQKSNYDVFISYGADQDRWWAHVVSDALIVMGYRPFFAIEPAWEFGGGALRAASEAVVTGANYFVVVASTTDSMDSVRVKMELELFLNSRMSEQDNTNVVTLVGGDIMPTRLSPEPTKVVRMSELDWRDLLRACLAARSCPS